MLFIKKNISFALQYILNTYKYMKKSVLKQDAFFMLKPMRRGLQTCLLSFVTNPLKCEIL